MKKTLFIILCTFHFLISVISGYFGKQFQFFIIGLLMLLFGFYLLKKNQFENKKNGFYIVFFPLLLFYFINSFAFLLIYNNYNLFPFLFIIILSEAFVYYFYAKHQNKIIFYSLLFVFLNGIGSFYLMNYYYFICSKLEDNKVVEKNLPNLGLKIYDEKGELLDLNRLKGKITVIDIWASNCSICIKGFPDFEKLKIEFDQDKEIDFYSLNIHQSRDNTIRVKILQKPLILKNYIHLKMVLKKLELMACQKL